MNVIQEQVDRVNYITDVWDDPCGADWVVYVESFGAASLNLAISLATFGLDDVVRAAARPKNVRQRPKLRRSGNSPRSRVPGLPEPGDEIGKRLPGAYELRQRTVSDGVRNLWILDGVLQRALWWWMVVDLSTQFAFDFTSQLYKSEACEKADSAYAKGTGPAAVAAIQGWQASNLGPPDTERGNIAWSGGAARLDVETGQYTYCFDVRETTGGANTIKTRIVSNRNGPGTVEDERSNSPDQDGKLQNIARCATLAGVTYNGENWADQGGADGEATAIASER